MLVLQAISGPDAGDVSSVPSQLDFDADAPVDGLRVGYFPAWMKENPATDVDRAALETVRKLGMTPTEVTLPDWPYDSLQHVLFAEAAASFEELTLSDGVDQLKMQVPDAWPNLFRAVALPVGGRFRAGRSAAAQGRAARWRASSPRSTCCSCRRCATRCSPSRNFTGHPSLTLRAGLRRGRRGAQRLGAGSEQSAAEVLAAAPRAARRDARSAGCSTRARSARVGIALERAFGVAGERPPGF